MHIKREITILHAIPITICRNIFFFFFLTQNLILLTGYSGVLCEVNIDDCKQNNCNPDTSQCVDQINSYTCNCLPGWTGKT